MASQSANQSSANTADLGNHEDPFDKVVTKPFGYHMNRWRKVQGLGTTERKVHVLRQHFQ
jgi:hypothetical protein